MIDRSVLVHYRTEGAKAYRREHGDRGGCKYQDKLHRPSPWPWSNSITTVTKDNLLCYTFRIAAFRGRDPDNPSDRKHPSNGRFCQRMEINAQGITNTLTSVGKDNMAYIEYE